MHAEGGPFRSFEEKAMLYGPLLSPWVHAKLCLLFANACFGKASVQKWSLGQALAFTISLWLVRAPFPLTRSNCGAATHTRASLQVSAGHGILLDWSTFKISWRVAVQFWASSFAAALANGICLAYVYARAPAAAKPKTTPTKRKAAK